MNHADKRAEDKNQHFSIIHVATSVLFSFRFQQCLKQAGKMHGQLDIMTRELPATKPLDTSRARDH